MREGEVAGGILAVFDGESVQWFQHRRGVVPEWSRFCHVVRERAGSELRSWCGQTWRMSEIEECSRPGEFTAGLPDAVQSCTSCVVHFAFRNSGPVLASAVPARVDTPEQMVSAMRVVQRDLAFEAERISFSDVHRGRIGSLAADTEQLARALQRFGWLAAQG